MKTIYKKFIIILIITIIVIFISLWILVSGGYDKQNKLILFIKQIIPTKIARNIRDVVFIIPDLKEQNRVLNIQVQKYEQGLNGNKFKEINVVSKKNKEKFLLKEFFLPFPRLDLRLGWAATENSKRAHYLEIIGDKVLVISGLGQTIFFEKKNIFNEKLSQKNIPNNLMELLSRKKHELIGIRDLFVEENTVYISLQHKDNNGFTINIYKANLNYDKLNFELFFETKEYWPKYNVFSGGRIESFKNNKILFSIGFAKNYLAPQEKKSLLGKIIAIDKISQNYELVSLGHRNPQGLFYFDKEDLIINTEHGPKGGDEINFNFAKDNKIKNFGWPIASYGEPYPGEKWKLEGKGWFKKSHSENGFNEPIKYFSPAIGISEITYLTKALNAKNENYMIVSSLRAASVYLLKLNDNFDKILDQDRLYFGQERLRDIEYDNENNVLFILFENTPSIGVLKFKL